jgi:hypothetical protein
LKKKKNNKNWRNIEETPFYQTNIPSEINMSTAAATQPILTIVKDEFVRVSPGCTPVGSRWTPAAGI